MSNRPVPEKFMVAFSFAGEQRPFVRAIAEAVENKLGRGTVFLDEWFEHYTAGNDSDDALQNIYLKRSTLVVLCVSKQYGEKAWTRTEHRAIRALQLQLDASQDPNANSRILPLRVGDGDVKGIFENSICPDVRKKSIEDIVNLIDGRLSLVVQYHSVGSDSRNATLANVAQWPMLSTQFNHGLADRTNREWPAILDLLTFNAPKRILMFEGPSGFSKSALLRAAFKYAKALRIPTAYVDFNDTKMLSEVNVLRELQFGLSPVVPNFAEHKEPDRWTFRRELRGLSGAALILLDAYEKAAETKELVEWIETQLLAEADECEQLRFIIGGQKIPNIAQAIWRARAEIVALDRIHDQHLWKDWVREMNPNVSEKHVEALVVGLDGMPGDISIALRTFAQKRIADD